MRVPWAARVSCLVSGCRGPATKYCFGTVPGFGLPPVRLGDHCLPSELSGWCRRPRCSRHWQPHGSRAAGNPGRGCCLWPAALPQSSVISRLRCPLLVWERPRLLSQVPDLTWETGEAANLTSAPPSPRGLQPRVVFPAAQGCRGRGGGGAVPRAPAWPGPRPRPALQSRGWGRAVGVDEEVGAVLAGSPAPRAQAFWIS